MLSAEVIVAFCNSHLPCPVAPVALVFTAESGGASLTSPDVQNLLCYSFHISDMLICVRKTVSQLAALADTLPKTDRS